MTRIFALRHPRPQVAAGICYGRADLVLADTAAAEIERAIAALRAMAPAGPVLSSPAHRCLCLAEAIGEAFSRPVTIDDALQELDFGCWEGRPWDLIDRAESDPWADNPWDRAPPGGERFADLHARVGGVLRLLPAGAVLVTHAGPIRAMRMILGGVSFGLAFGEAVPYAEPMELDLKGASGNG